MQKHKFKEKVGTRRRIEKQWQTNHKKRRKKKEMQMNKKTDGRRIRKHKVGRTLTKTVVDQPQRNADRKRNASE